MRLATSLIAIPAVMCAGAASASNLTTLYDVSEPLTNFSTLVDSLDIDSTSYQYGDILQGGATESGHDRNADEVLGTPIPGTEDRTSIVSRVYDVTSSRTFNMGGDSITVNPGDKIFSYTVRLVNSGTDTVDNLFQFKIQGLFGLPGVAEPLPGSLLDGFGFSTPGVGVATPLSGDSSINSFGAIGSFVDYVWDGADANNQLRNSEEIELLLFTSSDFAVPGIAEIASAEPVPAGQSGLAFQIPILVPSFTPTPGPVALGLLAMGGAAARRRR